MPALAEVNLVTAAAIFLLGLLGGTVLARLVLPSRRRLRELVTELEQARSEHLAYRAEVSEHFEKTSDLVASMTASYKAVYDHLALGAQTLCRDDVLGAGRFPAPRLVFDQDVSVGRAGIEPSESTAEEHVVPGGRIEGPILEMKREAPPATAAEAVSAAPGASEDDGDRPADSGSSPLH